MVKHSLPGRREVEVGPGLAVAGLLVCSLVGLAECQEAQLAREEERPGEVFTSRLGKLERS